jgi:hypothetical protein
VPQVPPAPPRGRPRKPVSPGTVEEEPAAFNFDLIIHVLLPDKKERVKGKTKTVKQDPEKVGPISIRSSTAWQDYVDTISQALKVPSEFLPVTTWDWQLSVPKSSPKVPVRCEDAFNSMIRSLTTENGKKRSLPYIWLFTEKPNYTPPVRFELWKGVPNLMSFQPTAGTSAHQALDEDELSNDDELGPMQKKARIDDALSSIVEKLMEKYKPGKCPVHLEITCFHHRGLDLHFDMGNRGRSLVWANAIKKGACTYDAPPLGQPLFKAEAAMKTKNSPATQGKNATTTAEDTQPAAPNPFHYSSPMAAAMMNPFAMFGLQAMSAMNPFMFPQAGANFPGCHGAGQPNPNHRHQRHSDDGQRSSSPGPFLPEVSAKEFCEQTGLPVVYADRLDAMGFTADVDLKSVGREDWIAAGFKLFEWQRVVRAHKQFKNSLRS